ICAALMIGFGRAIGETMIVLMATGNTPVTYGGLFAGLRSLAANVAVEMPEAAAGSAHYRVLFLSELVLLVFTLVVNPFAELLRQRLRRRYGQQDQPG
ncbi:phosphate ABC transporter permease, partial [Erwinia amylovora]|nr:phosphate ABC transporter permease [Erwinia amylovora]